MRRSKAGSRLSSANLHPLWPFVISIRAKFPKVPSEIRMATAFAVKREALTKRAFYENRFATYEGLERMGSF